MACKISVYMFAYVLKSISRPQCDNNLATARQIIKIKLQFIFELTTFLSCNAISVVESSEKSLIHIATHHFLPMTFLYRISYLYTGTWCLCVYLTCIKSA